MSSRYLHEYWLWIFFLVRRAERRAEHVTQRAGTEQQRRPRHTAALFLFSQSNKNLRLHSAQRGSPDKERKTKNKTAAPVKKQVPKTSAELNNNNNNKERQFAPSLGGGREGAPRRRNSARTTPTRIPHIVNNETHGRPWEGGREDEGGGEG